MSFQENYSRLDRMTHRLAFASRAVQETAMDVERSLYGRRYRDLPVTAPIFVTSLPRAGTTLLLEIFSGVPGLAAHRYRDMPFVLAPVLWAALSGGFRRSGQLGERAHGDGMLVSYDSPEAFEEVGWVYWWPDKFGDDGIALWTDADPVDGFRAFFAEQMRKILLLRLGPDAAAGRYVSKNNANVARLAFLARCFPDCRIIVPFRDPVEQAMSLLRQHTRFTEVHRNEAFSRRYMADIGHFEFGALHRPIRFPGLDETLGDRRPESLDYWIAYWIAAFAYVAGLGDLVRFVSYDRLCERGAAGLPALAAAAELDPGDLAAGAGPALRPPRPHAAEGAPTDDTDLLTRARALYARLLDLSIV